MTPLADVDAASGLGGAGSGSVVAGDARVDQDGARREARARASSSIGISGQMHSSVFLDAQGARHSSRAALVRRPHDRRVPRDHGARRRRGAAARSRVAIPRSRDSRCRRCCGCAITSPRRSRDSRRCCCAKDFIRYRLTGALATEPSDASATLMYDTAHLRWSDGDPRRGRSAACRSCPTSADRRTCSAR